MPIDLLAQSAALFCPKVESLHKSIRFAPSNHANHLPRTRTTPPALRHRVMVTVNQMDRMDCPYRHNAFGQNKAAD